MKFNGITKLVLALALLAMATSAYEKFGSEEFLDCGLWYYEPTTYTNYQIPLKSISIKATITNNIARVEMTQHYSNPFDFPIETNYKFPINPDAVFDKFTAQIGEKILVGEIKDKTAAKQEYEE